MGKEKLGAEEDGKAVVKTDKIYKNKPGIHVLAAVLSAPLSAFILI